MKIRAFYGLILSALLSGQIISMVRAPQKPRGALKNGLQLYDAIIHYSQGEKNLGKIKKLVGTKNIDLNFQRRDAAVLPDFKGITPLIAAVRNKTNDVVALLIKAGADLNLQDDFGWSALHHAADEENVEAAQRLLTAGINPYLKTKKGYTARDIAVELGNRIAGYDTGIMKAIDDAFIASVVIKGTDEESPEGQQHKKPKTKH